MGMVFGGSPHHRWSANVDLFDGLIPAHTGFGDGGFKRVEIHHHQLDGRDVLGLHVGLVGRLAGAAQDAAVDAWVQGLDPAPQDFGGSGVFRHLGDGEPCIGQAFCGAAAGEQLEAMAFHQGAGQRFNPLFVRHTQQSQTGHGDRRDSQSLMVWGGPDAAVG